MSLFYKISSYLPVSIRCKLILEIPRTLSSAATSKSSVKVTVLGAAGQIGQPLSLMLKNSPYFDELALYDMTSTTGICMELSHIDTKCKVASYKGKIREALENAQIVAIVAGASRMSYCDFEAMFKPNAAIIFDLVTSCARFCPKALLVISTNPVNCMVPIASEVMKKFRVYNPCHIFGMMTLDVMRANMHSARTMGLPPEQVVVPVIGGHSANTIVPVLSQAHPKSEFTNEELIKITDDVQNASENLVRIRRVGAMSLSAAFAVSRFVISLAKAMKGEQNIVECAYVASNLYSNVTYLSTPLLLGLDGIQKNIGIPKLSDYENCLLQNAAMVLREDIKVANAFVSGKGYKPTHTGMKADHCFLELNANLSSCK